MADKEATVYILDLGSSMAECNNGRTESDLDWSMRYVWDKITTTVAASRKTWTLGVLGVRTDETNHSLQEEDGYENISVLRDIGPMSLPEMRELQAKVVPSDTVFGDCVSAIVVAIDMIEKYTKKLKYNRKIVVVTNGEASIDGDDIAAIASRIKTVGITLTVLGVDFDDNGFGFKEEDKTNQKATNEQILKELADACEGQYGTIAEAIEELDTPRLKPVRPFKTYDGPLTLGDPDNDNSMKISVERYFKTHKAPVPPASNVVVKSDNATQSTATMDGDAMQGIDTSGGEFAAVKSSRNYKVNDPGAPGGKRDVPFEDLAKGYEYGRTAVHISESEHNITKLETERGFAIIGFIGQEKYEPFLTTGETGTIVAQKFNRDAALKLSSLIHSLLELESYAIARLVAKDGKEPVLLLLAPFVDVDFECLYDVPLPFAEDVRSYLFPPLDKVVTHTGATLSQHRYLPNDELNETMSDYVDAMDISTYEMDENGKRTQEYAAVEDNYCPALHRINQVVRHRAIYPDQPPPPVTPVLLKYAQPDQDLVEKAQTVLADLIDTAQVKTVPPKATAKRQKAKVKAMSGLDVDALLRQPQHKRTKLDPRNAVADFNHMVNTAESEAVFEQAALQMGQIVCNLITDSLADFHYERAVECIGVFRHQMNNIEEPGHYNNFMKSFKKKVLSGELGGDRREFWHWVKLRKLGLIDDSMSDVSRVSTTEAEEFYKQ